MPAPDLSPGCEPAGPPCDGLRRLLHTLAREIGLQRHDRLDLAENLLRRDITSWADLTHAEALRLVDALHGHTLVMHLLLTQRHAEITALCTP